MKNNENELDDLVIKVLSHQERKRILKIVGSYPEGVNYTGILGETGLSTGRLNYHLGELVASAFNIGKESDDIRSAEAVLDDCHKGK